MITAHLNDDQQKRAELVFTILNGLENGMPLDNWIEQLRETDIGSFEGQWAFACCLGAKGCETSWNATALWLRGVPHNLEYNDSLNHLPKKRKLFRLPFDRSAASEAEPELIDCLETSAKIAYVQGFEVAMRICVAEMSNQKPFSRPHRMWAPNSARIDTMLRTTWEAEGKYQSHTINCLYK